MERGCIFILLKVFRICCSVVESLTKEFALCGIEKIAFREDDFEFEIKIAETHGVFIERHTQLLKCLSFFIF